MGLTFGVAALGRPTFDVPYAEEKLAAAFATLDAANIKTVGPRTLLYDAEAAEQAVGEIKTGGQIDALLIIQVTFTDATMTVELARDAGAPVAIWALPEPRAGGRLRLNAFCGLNLAAHALGKADISHGWLYADPEQKGIAESLKSLAVSPRRPDSRAAPSVTAAANTATSAVEAIRGSSITVLGEHPAGFDTCSYDDNELRARFGVSITALPLNEAFGRARAADSSRVDDIKLAVGSDLTGLDAVDQEQLDRSFRLYCALEDIQKDTGASGLAVRCWPETFTEYGCAACGPMAMMNQRKTPSACEADVYGSLSALLLQELAQEPVWMSDLVDLDFNDNTGVFWHCGLAPLSMADPEATPEATIHTNRKMPLLHQFPLKPGKFTMARLSQARNNLKLVIGAAEFVRAPMAFTGTSGVAKFTTPTKEFCQTVIDEGLEHHFAIAYGDHRDALRASASVWNIPVLEAC
ncbi:MAG: hypothetical protein AAGB02_06465 [Pseudomonadota bacterium]